MWLLNRSHALVEKEIIGTHAGRISVKAKEMFVRPSFVKPGLEGTEVAWDPCPMTGRHPAIIMGATTLHGQPIVVNGYPPINIDGIMFEGKRADIKWIGYED